MKMNADYDEFSSQFRVLGTSLSLIGYGVYDMISFLCQFSAHDTESIKISTTISTTRSGKE